MGTGQGDRPWYLARLKAGGAAVALRNLERQGMEGFLPQEACTRRRGGAFVTVTAPLFPGYLFLRAAPGAVPDWRAVNATRGIARLVAFGSTPARVPPGIVEALIARCDPQGRVQPDPALGPGDRVRIASGPFADLMAEIVSAAPDRRIWLLLDIMGTPTRVAIAPERLRSL